MTLFAKENSNNKEVMEAIEKMKTQIKENGGRFTFDFKIDEEGWFAQCREYRGIMIGGRKKNPSEKEIMQALINAIKVAFHVPIDKLEIGKEELASQKISIVREMCLV